MVTSYNGWTASKSPASIDIDPDFTAAGRKFPGGVKRGPVSVVLRYVAEQFDKRVEELDTYQPGDEWGYHFKNSANSPRLISNHSSGTALDLNATRHPNGTKASRTFTAEQIATIKAILAELDGVVRWLGEAKTPDPMHFEIVGNEMEVARVAGRILSGSPVPEEDDMPLNDADKKWLTEKITEVVVGEIRKVPGWVAGEGSKATLEDVIGEVRKVPGWVNELAGDG